MHFNTKWITYKTGEYKTLDDQYGNPSPYFRKTFTLRDSVKKATLLISSMGCYKAYLNGHPIAEDYLSPGWVDYNKKMPFVRYDISKRVGEENAIGVVLGDGWAIGHVGSTTTFKRNSYCDHLELTAQIVIEYEDGTTETIATDSTWKATSGEIRRSDIYMGEYVDRRLHVGDFSLYSYNDKEWDSAEEVAFRFTRSIYLEEVTLPPIVVKHKFKPSLLSQENNTYLYDVSQNISGVLNCLFKGERGSKVVIRHGEILSDGKLYTDNLRKAEATDTYILSGKGIERFRPIFTFHGFRYAELCVTGNVEILDITAEAMYTDLLGSGSFSCSDPIVTKIYQNALWGQRDNFLNVPTDCPQRDERLGWTADAQVFCKSAMYNMNCKAFYEKYLSDIRDAQLGNGIIPAVAPLPHFGFHSYVGHVPAAGWSEAIAEIPYYHYEMYGDKTVVRNNLPALKRLLDYYESTCPKYIRRPTGFSYSDWLSLDESDKDVISTLYYARAAYVASKLCGVIGDHEEKRYLDLYNNIKSAFPNAFVDTDGKILSDTQSVYLIAFKFGIIDKEFALKNLNRKFIEDNNKLTCGFLGIRFLLPALCDLGRVDLAYHLITNTEYPGWGYSVVNGATTIWERWDSYTKENGIREGMNSFNHYSFGSCTEWMYEYCLGIRPVFDHPGFKKVIFAPYFDPSQRITWAKGHYDTQYGQIKVQWELTGDTVNYEVTIPDEIEAEFSFNGFYVIDKTNKNNNYVFTLKKT